ncbi:MAG: hypothetical protein GX793_00905 [Bacteroidales bacterium]|jgi:hypothetical protein|nr:hypothetical protein [Bacteroidales bacterium]MDY0313939.1 hypothetical protein [Bacteroidales bacterium]NLB85599.1 hypothetical protein [Bacteroidales bacterium]
MFFDDFTKEKIDEISKKVSSLHNLIITDFLKSKDVGMKLDANSYQSMLFFINEKIRKYIADNEENKSTFFLPPFPFPWNPKPQFPPYLLTYEGAQNYLKVSSKISDTEGLKLSFYSFNLSVFPLLNVSNICRLIEQIIVISNSYIEESSSFEEFCLKMDEVFKSISKELLYYADYFFVKLFYEVYIGSIELWGSHKIQLKTSFWEGVKKAWNDYIKPVAIEDGKGAVGGGIGGACAGAIVGGIGAMPGATAGAVSCSVANSIIKSFDYL